MCLLLVGVIAAIIIILYILYKIYKKQIDEKCFLKSIAVAALLFFLFSAPSLRFGMWWVVFAIAISIDFVLPYINKRLDKAMHYLKVIVVMGGLLGTVGVCLICVRKLKNRTVERDPGFSLLRAADYYDMDACNASYDINGISFYYLTPNPTGKNGTNGYRGFPGTECRDTLEKIKMYTDDLADGFAVKDAYRNVKYDFQGVIVE